ncbi:MAG: zinc ribbon domain-containing protein [Gemmatimonadales bacterium]
MSELHRFTHQLVESLGAHDPAALGAPVALDDITTLVLPYRACRRLFGILNVEDYELLLLRLVGGEAGLAVAAPLDAVERCRAELDTGHPDPGVVNDLEGVTLRLNLGAIALGDVVSEDAGASIVRSYSLYEPEAEPEPEPEQVPGAAEESRASQGPAESVEEEAELEPEEDEATASPAPAEMSARPGDDEAAEFDFVDTPAAVIDDAPPTPEPAAADPGPEPAPETDPFQELFDAPGDTAEPEPEIREPPPPAIAAPLEPIAPPPPAAHGEPPPRCPHCASRLPSGRPVRFCPHCGSNVVPLQCVSCGAGLEPAWRHCVLCGAPAVNDSRFA